MPLIDVDLQQFCSTGVLGPITVGMTKAQMEQLLGTPHEWGGSWPGWPQAKQRKAARFTLPYTEYPIWKYDAIEFHFGDSTCQLYLIWCDHLNQLARDGQAFHLHLWVFGDLRPLHKDRCIQALRNEGIQFEDRVFPYGGRIMLLSGVELSYENDHEQEIVGIGKYAEHYAT
jgi:hypothetical protein